MGQQISTVEGDPRRSPAKEQRMDFDDLRTDIDLECPHCNRWFQQDGESSEEATTTECPGCGKAVRVPKPGTGSKD